MFTGPEADDSLRTPTTALEDSEPNESAVNFDCVMDGAPARAAPPFLPGFS